MCSHVVSEHGLYTYLLWSSIRKSCIKHPNLWKLDHGNLAVNIQPPGKHSQHYEQNLGMEKHPHRIHGTGIFTYIWLIFMVNVGRYTSPMDPLGSKEVLTGLPSLDICEVASDSGITTSASFLAILSTLIVIILGNKVEAIGNLQWSLLVLRDWTITTV